MSAKNRAVNGFVNSLEKRLPLFLAAFACLAIGTLSVLQPLALVLVAVFLLYLLLAVTRFDWVLLLTVFTFPLIPQYVGFDFQGLAIINLQRVLIVGLYVAWAVRKIYSGEKIIIRTPLNFALALFLLLRIMGVIFSLDFGVSLSRYLSQLFTFYLIYYVIIDSVSTRKEIDRILRSLVASGVVASLMGILEFFSKWNVYAYLIPVRQDTLLTALKLQSRLGMTRIEGALGHSLAMGMFLALVLPICLGGLVAVPYRKRKIWLATGFVVSAAAVLTFSRGTWVGLAFILVAFTLRYPKQFVPYAAVILLGAGFGILGLSQRSDVRAFMERTTESAKKADIAVSTAQRFSQMEVGLPIILQRPLTGYGIDQGKRATGLRAVDNYYLTIALESGIPSLLGFAGLMLLLFGRLKKVIQSSPDFEVRNQAFSIFVSLASWAFILAVVSLTQVFFVWWVLAALGMRTALNEKARWAPPDRASR